jgi:hypothetical protein
MKSLREGVAGRIRETGEEAPSRKAAKSRTAAGTLAGMFAEAVREEPRSLTSDGSPVPPAITVAVPVTSVGREQAVIVFSAGDDEAVSFETPPPPGF